MLKPNKARCSIYKFYGNDISLTSHNRIGKCSIYICKLNPTEQYCLILTSLRYATFTKTSC